MKTTLKSIAMLALMFGTFMGHASDTDFGSDPKVKTTVVFSFPDVKKGHEITIKTSDEAVVHREKIERNGDYIKKFDLTSLANGSYVIELEKDFEIIIKPFSIINNEVFFDRSAVKSIYKPVLRIKDNKVYASVLNLDSKPMIIELFYKGQLIHSENTSGKQITERVYALAKEQSGPYQAVFKIEDRSFVENFNI